MYSCFYVCIIYIYAINFKSRISLTSPYISIFISDYYYYFSNRNSSALPIPLKGSLVNYITEEERSEVHYSEVGIAQRRQMTALVSVLTGSLFHIDTPFLSLICLFVCSFFLSFFVIIFIAVAVVYYDRTFVCYKKRELT